MKYLKNYLLLPVLLLSGIQLFAQDRIYYKQNKTDNWKVTDISAGYLKGTDIKNPEIACSISQSNVLFIFNSKGNFLVIPGLYDSPEKSQLYTSHFLQFPGNSLHEADRIITAKNNIITCQIESEKEQGIVYAIGNREFLIPKTEIALIIYRGGSHKLIATAEKVFKVLKAIQPEYNLASSISRKKSIISNEPKDTGANLEKNIPQATPLNKEKNTGLPGSDKTFTVNNVTPKKIQDNPDSSLVKPAVFRLNNNAEPMKSPDASTIGSLQEKAILNIKELESYIKLISDKQSDPDQVTRAVNQAISLFASEDSRIEVSSVSRTEPQQFKVRVYLNRLGLMKYNKIIVDWYDVQYVSKLRKNPDGTYTGFIEFEQRFTGISGDRKSYQDVTRKTVEIILKSYYKKSGGETTLAWDVFLGNIGITVTKGS